MSRENDARVADILRVVEKLAADRDTDGLVFIFGGIDFATHTPAEAVAIFAAALPHVPSANLSKLHLAALEEETVNTRMHEEWAVEDAKNAERDAARFAEAN